MKDTIKKLLNIMSNSFLRRYYVRKGAKIGKDLRLQGKPHIYIAPGGTLSIGDGCSVNSGLKYNPIGGDTKAIFRVWSGGNLKLGDGTKMSNSSIVCTKGIDLGKNVFLGGSVKIYDTDFHAINAYNRIHGDDLALSKEIIIEDDCFIGAHSIILKGSRIGKGSIIGAGSVVSGSIPAGEIWAGNPARFIKKVDDDK